jgi:four helix bundle protein
MSLGHQEVNMSDSQHEKKYDLEQRSEIFAGDVAILCNGLPYSLSNIEYSRQLIRSSGSIGANYIEANEAFSTKDFVYRVKICRKEAKESAMWIRLLKRTNTKQLNDKLEQLHTEAIELKKIMSSIIIKSGG